MSACSSKRDQLSSPKDDSTRRRKIACIQSKTMRIALVKTRDHFEQRFVRGENNSIVFQCVLKEINEYCTLAKETI